MIQQITSSVNSFWKRKDKFLIIFILFISYLLLEAFLKYHHKDEASLLQLLNNIFQFSGIFSAIIITYIISKVFQSRQERLERKKEIIELSNKLTDFRRIARVLTSCYGFWNSEMRKKIDRTYANLDFFDLQNWDYENQDKYPETKALRKKFFEEENIPGAYLYLDMKSLVLENSQDWQLELYDKFDHDFTYSVEILSKWTNSHSGGNLWYCLDNKWHSYKDCFDFTALREAQKEEIQHLAKKINQDKFRNRKFDNTLLADIGSDMDTFYLPRLFNATYFNSLGLSKTLNFLLTILFLTIVTGVLTPLILTAIKVSFTVLLVFSSFAVSVLCISLLYFLIEFKNILTLEINV